MTDPLSSAKEGLGTSSTEETHLHPIGELVRSLLQTSEPPMTLDIDSLDELEDEIEALLDLPELQEAVETLLMISHTLEIEHEAIQPARAIVSLVEREHVLQALRALEHQAEATIAETEATDVTVKTNVFIETPRAKALLRAHTPRPKLPPNAVTEPMAHPPTDSSNEAPDSSDTNSAIKIGNLAFPKRL